jgi:hypothetical protein
MIVAQNPELRDSVAIPLMAPLRHADCPGQCPLSRVTRIPFAYPESFSVGPMPEVAAEILADTLFRASGTESCLRSHRVGRKIFCGARTSGWLTCFG